MAAFDGRVLVLGANGETGRRVVRVLRAKDIPVRVLVRSEARAQDAGLTGSGVEVVVGDVLDEADLQRACAGVKAVISTLGAGMQTPPETMEAIEHTVLARLSALAKANGIQQIVICSSMGTETPDVIPPLAALLRIKRKGEQALEQGGVPYTIVRPGGLVNEPGGEVLAQRTIRGFGRISRDDVAEVLVQAILQPQARNTIVEIINQPGAGSPGRADLFKDAAR